MRRARQGELLAHHRAHIHRRGPLRERVEIGMVGGLGIGAEHGRVHIHVHLVQHVGEAPPALAADHRVTLLHRGTLPDPFGDRVERLRGDRTTGDLDRLLAGRTFDAVVDLAAYTGEDGRRAAALLDGRVGHYVMVSTGQVYLVREGCPRPAREEDYDGPVMARPADPASRPSSTTTSR